MQWIHKSEQVRPVEGGLTYSLTPKKKKKPSTLSRVCGMSVALVFIVVAVYIAQRMGHQLIMYFAFGIAALCVLLCFGIGTGKVTPSTYMGTLDM